MTEIPAGGWWIIIQGQSALWFPPDYQYSSSTANNGTIPLGCTNGRAIIISSHLYTLYYTGYTSNSVIFSNLFSRSGLGRTELYNVIYGIDITFAMFWL
jgi:hypothetical protein